MSTPRLRLTWTDDEDIIHVYWDPVTGQWSSDYEEPVVGNAYIQLVTSLTDDAFLMRYSYEPYPFLRRIEELSSIIGFALEGMREVVDYLNARLAEAEENGALVRY
jgi:hypothetical protein